MTATEKKPAGYFVVRGRRATPSGHAYRAACARARVPAVHVSRRGRRLHASVDLSTAGVNVSSFDATADVKLRAVLGATFDPDVFEGENRCGFYSGDVESRDLEALGREVAAIVEDGTPYIWRRSEEDAPAEVRPTDWPALAAYWLEHSRTDSARLAASVGYFVQRSVKEVGQFDYRAYCEMIGRPFILCRIRHRRAEVTFRRSDRVSSSAELPADVCARVEAALEAEMGRDALRAAGVRFYGSSVAGGFLNVPEPFAELAASQLARLAGAAAS